MTERTAAEFDRARGRMAVDFRSMITDGEDLLKATVSASGEGLAAARSKFEAKLRHARSALADASQPIVERTRKTAAAADDYIHGNPWPVIAAALAAGVVLGLLNRQR